MIWLLTIVVILAVAGFAVLIATENDAAVLSLLGAAVIIAITTGIIMYSNSPSWDEAPYSYSVEGQTLYFKEYTKVGECVTIPYYWQMNPDITHIGFKYFDKPLNVKLANGFYYTCRPKPEVKDKIVDSPTCK